jgi:long-chain acyl-CoA synthetase
MEFVPRRRTLVEIFEHAIDQHGPRPLFGEKRAGRWEWTTYGGFASMVDRLRRGLSSLAVRPADRIAIVSNNRVEWAVVAYACYTLGAVVVPMYEAQHPEEWAFILRDCEAKVLIVASEALFARAQGLLESVSTLEHIAVIDGDPSGDARVRSYRSLLDSPAEFPRARPAPSDTAGLIYTSGTTGRPKGVVLTHANIAFNLGALEELVPRADDDRSLSILPWAHVFGQTVELHGVLSIGGSIAISTGVDRISTELLEVKPTVLFSVPRVFNRLYTAVQEQLARKPKAVRSAVFAALRVSSKESAGEPLRPLERALRSVVDQVVFARVRARLGGRLRHAVSGGASLSKEVAEFIDALGITVYEGYGLTETSPVATTNFPGARKLGSVGRPIPGVRVEIHSTANGPGSVAATGAGSRAEGEIVVYGHNVMKGYFKRPDETAAALTPDGGLRTGDLGYVDDQGFLFVTGRIKEQYKLENGKYVVPGPLEEQLKLSPFVANAMVYGANRPYNVAVVVADLSAVRRWAADRGLDLPASDEAVLAGDAVRSLFEAQVSEHGTVARGFEKIRDFVLVATDFTPENGMLTPTLKLKRRAIVEAYQGRIERLYEHAKDRRAEPAGARERMTGPKTGRIDR